MEAMEATEEGSGRQVEGMEVRPASVSSTAPPARGCSAASAGPAAVQPEYKKYFNHDRTRSEGVFEERIQ